MQWLEKASWEGAPHYTHKDPHNRQGPDLSDPTFGVDEDTGAPIAIFNGLRGPTTLRKYELPLRQALFNTVRLMDSPESKGLTKFQKAVKNQPYSKRKKNLTASLLYMVL